MIWFLLAVLLVLCIGVVGVLQPYYRARKAQDATRAQININIYKEQIDRLDQDIASGLLAPEQAALSVREIETRVAQEVLPDAADKSATSSKATTDSSPFRSRATVLALGIGLPVLALGIYAVVGSPNAVLVAATLSAGSPHHRAANRGQPDVQSMVTSLAKKLEQDPDNPQGWAMLARSYKVMGNTIEAEKAYDRAGSFLMKDPQLLADYADVAVANAKGDFTGKPTQLLERALAIDPKHPMALWLAGTAAMQRQDQKAAKAYFQRLLKELPPGSDDAQMVESILAKLGGGDTKK